MKTASTELFDLINSLTISEKSYFKRYAGTHKSNASTYLKLFEVIAAQETYCEEKVKELLKNEKLVSYFSRAKKYLYDKILESMRLYNVDKNIKSQLWRKYEDATFLYSRRQYKAAWRLVKKIKEDAEKAECWFVYTEAIRLEMSLTSETSNMQVAIEQWDTIIQQALEQAHNVIHFKLVGKLLIHHWNIHTPQETKSLYPTFYKQYLDKKGSHLQPTTEEAQIYHTRCLAIYHKAMGNWEESYLNMKKVIALFERNPAVLDKNFLLYYYVLVDLAIIGSDRLNQKMAKRNIEKIDAYIFHKNSPVLKNDFLKAQILPHHYYNKLIYCFKFALHSEALLIVKESISSLKKYKYLISEIAYLLLCQVYLLIYLVHENWEEALYWINQTLSLKSKHHKFSFVNAQLWQLIIHVELQNDQLLESMLRNTIRSWKQQGVFNDNLQNITKLIHQKLYQHYPNFWADLSVAVLKEADKNNYNGVDTLYSFAESRIQGRDFAVVRKELVEIVKNDFLQNSMADNHTDLSKTI